VITISSVIGNVFYDTEYAEKFKKVRGTANCELIKVSRSELDKTRFRINTDKGTDVGMVLNEISKLHNGDVLLSETERLIVIEQIPEKQTDKRTNSVGHSMGALTATNLLSSKYINAAILLAPMMSFELAAREYLPYKSPLLNKLFQNQLGDIVNQTMINAKVTIQETDLLYKLKGTEKPVLLINSNIDTLSPPAYFSSIQNEQVEKVLFKNRSHSSLMVFGSNDISEVEHWLLKL